ncbi:PREDICTED: hematopoietic prostaglandin D synthase-like isoform X2 [Nanorana parkeri]|uniref:hematopoietic prostaglandin D synthase-like isoform X1 n=1 Tax=Nanorana parkeri TaxID=125878 RepID=UPI000854EBC8|nr:PREDICTED: hematopoietic prostaglandin D synthase-like isoform X1 [Nanorana parkeri]XP_018410005.1 PREDICTED: hematopoietic prostaglandin D synthase-like isoform X1 [Nanorana parkeri]XP_018410006.1 PREDICTED: hematopoietic prostaglandin D synthase-like isoform X2 [Nanorana parkeri]
MPNYKLTYFNFKGRGEILRYIFAYTNTPFEDHRIEYSDWAAHKSSYPYGKLPVLEIDGVIYSQSLAISRYLAKPAGLRGKTEIDDLNIDITVDHLDDLVTLFPWEGDEKKIKEYMEKNVHPTLSGLEKALGDKKWFAGDYVTWADFFWDNCCDMFGHHQPGFENAYPHLLALRKRVQEIPAIAAWIKKRPESLF